eukprot:11714558-Alexandrium_andersonii.AAC.1
MLARAHSRVHARAWVRGCARARARVRACVRARAHARVRAWCFEDAARVPWERAEDAAKVMRGCCRGASAVLR